MASTEPVPAAAIEEILGILSAPDADLQEIVGLSREVCGVDAAGITLRYGDLLHVPVTNGLAPLVCDAVETFCAQTMDSDDIFHVEDAREDERFRDIGWVNGQLANLRFYASAPIYALDTMVGRLCVVDTHPKVLSAVQRRTLETLALSVTKVIELHLLRARRSEPGTLDVRQAAATLMSQLSAELTHDLRVPLSAIVAGVEMLTETVGDHPDPTVPALLHRTTRAADRMMRMLDTSMEFDAISPEPTRRDVDLARLAKQLVLDSVALVESTGATVELGDLPVVHADPDDMYSVLQNLVTNAVKFARPDVPARVVVSGTGSRTGGGSRSPTTGWASRRTGGSTCSRCSAGSTRTSKGTASAWPRWPGSSPPTTDASASTTCRAAAWRSGSSSPTSPPSSSRSGRWRRGRAAAPATRTTTRPVSAACASARRGSPRTRWRPRAGCPRVRTRCPRRRA